MATTFIPGELWIPERVRTFTASGAITNRQFLVSRSHGVASAPVLEGEKCVGCSLDSYDTGDAKAEVVQQGRMTYTAADTHGVNVPLALGAAGTLQTAKQGNYIVGWSRRVVGTIGDKGIVEMDINAGQKTNEIVYYSGSITADASPTLDCEAGDYILKSLYVEETAGNAITGGLNVGNAASGKQLAATLTVGASTAYLYLTASLAAVKLTFTEDDQIFIHAETSWNSADIIFKLTLERI